MRDIYQEPIVKINISNDPKLKFLKQMSIWLDTWKCEKFQKKLTRQTEKALSHTIYGMLEIVSYCFAELNLNYVLLGKLQTDPLESRFGKYLTLLLIYYGP